MKRILILAFFLLSPYGVDAATLYLSPSSGSYTTGKAFTVNVLVSSPGEAMNAVSATLAVDTSKFSIVSASSVGSVVNFWVQQPQVSGSAVSFEGVVLNPGYQGSGAKVASMVLMPKASGSGSVSFSSASVLANDGQGSNILDSTSGGSYSITEAVTAPPVTQTPSAPAVKDTEQEEVVEDTAEQSEMAEVPQITSYNDSISFGDLVALRGVTYENATVEFLIYRNGTLITREEVISSAVGDYSVVFAKRLEAGTYQIFARVTTAEGVQSSTAGPFPLTVKGDLFSALSWLTAGHVALLLLGILAVLGAFSLLQMLGFRRLFKMTKELQESHAQSTDMSRKVFDILKKDLASHVKKIRTAGEDRVLTSEELAFLRDFSDELGEAEIALRPKRKKKSTP